MHTQTIYRLRQTAGAFAIAIGALAAQAACAQQAELPPSIAPVNGNESQSFDQTIVVTGSRIARRGLESASPVEVIDSRRLDARGFETLGQALNELPTFGIPGASTVGAGQSAFGSGQSFVDFLGLGSQRTLTLVNGRRFVSSNTASIFGPTGSGGGQVDLNVIPTKLIDRVETVAAIGAPIYGSDAIAGTVNVILKKDFEGLDIDVQNGVSWRGDAPDYRVRALAGKNFASGRGNITIAGEYDQSKGLLYSDRSITASDMRFQAARSGSGQSLYPDLRLAAVDPSGVIAVGGAAFGLDFPLSPQQAAFVGPQLPFRDPRINFGVVNGAGQTLRFAPDGSLTPIDFGTPVGPDAGLNAFVNGGNGFSLASVANLVTDLKRYSVNTNLSYALTDKVRLFGEAWYTVSEGRSLARQPAYNAAPFGAAGSTQGSLVIPLSNPFLSDASRAVIQAAIAANPYSDQNLFRRPQNYFYLGRAHTDLSPGVQTSRSQVLRFVGGLDGTVNVLKDRDWQVEAYFNFGRALVTSRNPELNQQNFLNALNAVRDGTGAIVCAPGYTNSAAATISSTCAPLNPFGQQVSQAAKDYVTSIATPRSVNHQYDAVASVSGALADLPGGALSFALGYEHRAEDSDFDPGTFYYGSGTGSTAQRVSYGRAVPVNPVHGAFHTNEAFGELNADVLGPGNGIPLVYALTLQAAARQIWHSQAGNDPTYTFQARWAPVRDFAFRAAYTRAVRAPSITEAFAPNSSTTGFAVDVCDRSLVNQGPDPASRARNCAAAGVPATFTSLSSQRSFPNYQFGNPGLRNEKSDSYTVGAVLTPSMLPGFNATVDYIDITLKDAIGLFANDDVVKGCYDAASTVGNPYCDLIARDPASHQIVNLGTSYFNSARVKYKGIVAALNYRHATPLLGAASAMWLAASYQYLDTRSNQITANSVPQQLDNSVNYSRHKAIATVGYDNAGFGTQVQVNYVGPALIDANVSPGFYSVPTVGAFTTVNWSVSRTIGRSMTVRASVDNLFDAAPPYPYPASGGTLTYFSGILGRYVRVGAGIHF